MGGIFANAKTGLLRVPHSLHRPPSPKRLAAVDSFAALRIPCPTVEKRLEAGPQVVPCLTVEKGLVAGLQVVPSLTVECC